MGFHFDQTRCIGCYTCIVACKDWHDVEAGPANWIRVPAVEKGKFPDLYLGYLFLTCFHCASPPCVKACPVGAIIKRTEDGIVVVDREACVGGERCKFACRKACPYRAPQFGAEANPKMQKCNLCLERLKDGKKPICVDACLTRALLAGPLEELKAELGDIREAEGFVYSTKAAPSIIFKPKPETPEDQAGGPVKSGRK